MIEQKYFVINFVTRKENTLIKVPFRFEEASGVLDEFIDSVKTQDHDYWINHKLVYHEDHFIHQFDIFETTISGEYPKIKDYKEFINAKS